MHFPYLNREIENEEVLKRICEHVNQNVYLSLFNDQSINKANITFEVADIKTILPVIRESEKAMNDFATTPPDYRNALNNTVRTKPEVNTPSPATSFDNEGEMSSDYGGNMETTVEKAASFYAATQYCNSTKNLLNKIASLRCAEEQAAEKAFDKMAHDARILVAKGDSIGDISKIASRFAKEIGADFVKTARAYDMIHKDLLANNYNVKEEFTKISSLKINHDANLLVPVREFALSMEKIAGFSEMEQNISKVVSAFERIIKKGNS